MKYTKFINFTIFLFCTLLLQSCAFNNPKYINLRSKPNNYYYSSVIYEKLKNNEAFTLKVFDRDVYKYYTVSTEDTDIVKSFLESLNNDNYVTEMEVTDKCRYELIIEFKDSKFIINAYSSDFVTLYPYDGNFKEDMINTNGVTPYNNIYSFCSYVINKAHQNQ